MFKDNAYEILEQRGFVYQQTHAEEIRKRLKQGPVTFYLGIDPTADDLHIGHFFSLQMFRILQDCGHKGILLIGGATALIGDPTGKKDMRKLMPKEQVEHNAKELMSLVKHFVKVDGDNPAIIVNNADWFKNQNYVTFMREIGIHFNVCQMLACDAYKNRLNEGGLTFFEMGYMLMQAYDFVHLNKEFGCTLEIGGSDQWSNILAGVDLLRKLNLIEGKERETIMGYTCPLLTNAEGQKMGKTEKGTLWVTRDKTSVFDFYQCFVNSLDADVERLLRFFSKIDVAEIQQLCKQDIVKAKKLMAFEVTKLVHGEEEAQKAQQTAEQMFSNKDFSSANTPTEEVEFSGKEMNVVDFLAQTSLFGSKGEIRRLIEQNGIKLDGKAISSVDDKIAKQKEIVIQKGKKTFLKIITK